MPKSNKILKENQSYGLYKLYLVLACAGNNVYVVKCNVCGSIRRMEGRNILDATGKWCPDCDKAHRKVGTDRAERLKPSPGDRSSVQTLAESLPWR